jgi:thiol-disulfide isomerase/thioredoxin
MRQAGGFLGAVCGAVIAALVAAAPAGAEEVGFTPNPAIPTIKGIKALEKGSPAPTFAVKDLEGKPYDFGAEKTRRAHLLVFWSIFCEPCREEMPVIEKLADEHRAGDLEVLAVNMDGEPFLDGIRGFVKQYKYSVRILLDELSGEQFKIADPYQVAGTPVLYLVDAKGQVYWSNVGRIGEADLKAVITGMLGGTK